MKIKFEKINMSWTRFNKYLYKYWKKQVFVICLGYILMILSLVSPYIAKLMIDKAYLGKNLKLFFILIAIEAFIIIVGLVIGYFNGYFSKWIRKKVNFDMTIDYFRHLQNLDLKFHNSHSIGERIYRVNTDVSKVSGFVCGIVPKICVVLPRLVFILAIVFILDWKIAVLAIALAPLVYIQPYFFSKWLKRLARKQILKAQSILKRLQEVFSHIFIIKVFSRKEDESEKFKKDISERFELALENVKLSQLSGVFGAFSKKIVVGGITLFGGYQVIKGDMTLGSFTAIMMYLNQLIGLFKAIGGFYKKIVVSSVSIDRLAEVMDVEPSVYNEGTAVDCKIDKGDIEFRNVSFGYEKEIDVFKGINFSIEFGEKVAFVGSSGSGKSTLISLFLRLYNCREGNIFIDGVDIRSMKIDSLLSHIAISAQRQFLWDDTIFNNILYGTPWANCEDVERVSKISCVNSFAERKSEKYDFVIGEMGCKLSQGQKQRISIARAVIRDPKILILDETMSSLDSETEDRIIDNIWKEYSEKTVIVVSHRISTVKRTDWVYFIENNSNIIKGKHKDLIVNNKKYQELFSNQIN